LKGTKAQRERLTRKKDSREIKRKGGGGPSVKEGGAIKNFPRRGGGMGIKKKIPRVGNTMVRERRLTREKKARKFKGS